MNKYIALILCVIFVTYLFVRDRKLRPITSRSLWVVLVWVTIVGSRPISMWFSGKININLEPDSYMDGSPLDRNIFLVLIFLGIYILWKRRINLSKLCSSNIGLFVFFLYCGISVIWSEYPFIGIKRWIKDLGNIIMVSIIVSEKDPVQATKYVLSRFSYIVIPFSILFIKYFPEYGRYYDSWRWTPVYCGIGTEKNYLGTITVICGVFLFWDYLENRSFSKNINYVINIDVFTRIIIHVMIPIIMLFMIVYLLDKASSSTAIACIIIGTAIIIIMRCPFAVRHVKHIGTYCIAGCCVVFIIYITSDIIGIITDLFNRDITFTGRATNIWPKLMNEEINPVIGTGYKSFWSLDRMDRLSLSPRFRLNTAHNGYLETYLNTGIIGLGLLIISIIYAFRNLKKIYYIDNNFAILLFSFLFVQLFNNISESLFNMQSISWIVFLLASFTYTDLKAQEGRETCDQAGIPAWQVE